MSGSPRLLPTKRAPDAGDSAAFPSLFLRLIIFPVGRRPAARPSAGNANRWTATASPGRPLHHQWIKIFPFSSPINFSSFFHDFSSFFQFYPQPPFFRPDMTKGQGVKPINSPARRRRYHPPLKIKGNVRAPRRARARGYPLGAPPRANVPKRREPSRKHPLDFEPQGGR